MSQAGTQGRNFEVGTDAEDIWGYRGKLPTGLFLVAYSVYDLTHSRDGTAHSSLAWTLPHK